MAAKVTLRLIKECTRQHVFWSIENPLSSALWKWPPLARYLSKHCIPNVTVHMCEYGACYLKPAHLVGTLPTLAS